jgi:hypothetical protein
MKLPPLVLLGALGMGSVPWETDSSQGCPLKFLAAPLVPAGDCTARGVTGPKCLTTHYLLVKSLGRNKQRKHKNRFNYSI